MAISRIKKIELIAVKEDKNELLLLLQKLGIVELIQPDEAIKIKEIEAGPANLLEIEEALLYLASFQEEPGFLKGMVKLKPLVYQQELREVISKFDYSGILKELSELRSQQKVLAQHKERLLQEKQLLAPWVNLKILLNQISYTKDCGILLGMLDSSDYNNLLEDAKKAGLNLFSECINQDKTNCYLIIFYLKEDFEHLEIILKSHHFNFVTLSQHKATVEDRLLEINQEILFLEDQMQDTKDKLFNLSQQQFKLMVVYDYLNNIEQRKEAEKGLNLQEYTFSLSGWLRGKDIELLKKKITDRFKNIAIFISEPKATDNIPTALQNKPVIQPFEAVTNLYGQPVYKGIDPSSLLAPFFALSFGLCMMDVGYGLILFLVILFYLSKRQISPAGKNFLRLFLFMSIATIFAGVITGNFFADLISRLPAQFNFLKNIQMRFIFFDPIKNSLLFLGITLSLGYIQIWTGVLIKFIRDLRTDRFTAFILDLPTLLIQTGLLILVLVFAKVLPIFMLKIAVIFLIVSCGLVIYYQWRANPDLGQKIFWSIFGIYAIITGNFLADTLSFSRIFALGISGGLLGMAINVILLPKAMPESFSALLGALIAIILWFVFQLLILAINILGAYVQTSRLQYLEFFTKFFESGGRPFRPFKEETKYIFLAQE